jgi:hypothetical protein
MPLLADFVIPARILLLLIGILAIGRIIILLANKNSDDNKKYMREAEIEKLSVDNKEYTEELTSEEISEGEDKMSNEEILYYVELEYIQHTTTEHDDGTTDEETTIIGFGPYTRTDAEKTYNTLVNAITKKEETVELGNELNEDNEADYEKTTLFLANYKVKNVSIITKEYE